MSKFTEFSYNDKNRKVLEFKGKDPKYLEGVEYSAMTKEDQEAFTKLFDQLDPFIKKYYRRFFVNQIQDLKH